MQIPQHLTRRAILKLAAFFRRTHNLSFEEFSRLTPRELHELEKQRQKEITDERDQTAIHVAHVICMLVAVNTPKGKQAPKLESFLPGPTRERVRKQQKIQSHEEMIATMKSIGGGRVFRPAQKK